MHRLGNTLRQIRTLHELDQAIRDLRFSKRYALGLPEALAELDQLYAARERLERRGHVWVQGGDGPTCRRCNGLQAEMRDRPCPADAP